LAADHCGVRTRCGRIPRPTPLTTGSAAPSVNDGRVASITLSRKGEPDAGAVQDGGTYVIPGVVGLEENSPGAHLTVRDAAGNDLERLAYRQNT